MQILLVEPDTLLAQTYKQTLESAGHEVVVDGTAQGAVLAADLSKPELVILELQLASHGGIEFLYEFRSYPDWQHIPVMVLSHVPPAEFADNWKLLQHELGVEKYLYKPRTSLAKLERMVNQFVVAH